MVTQLPELEGQTPRGETLLFLFHGRSLGQALLKTPREY